MTSPRVDLDRLIDERVDPDNQRPEYNYDGLVEPAAGREDAPKIDDSGELIRIADEVFDELRVDDPGAYEGCRIHQHLHELPADGILGKVTEAVWRYIVRRRVEIPKEYVAASQFNANWQLLDARVKIVTLPTWRWATPKSHDPENMRNSAIQRVEERRRFIVFAVAFVDVAGTSPIEYENGYPKRTGGSVPDEVARILKAVFKTQDKAEAEAAVERAEEALASKDRELAALRSSQAGLEARLDAFQRLLEKVSVAPAGPITDPSGTVVLDSLDELDVKPTPPPVPVEDPGVGPDLEALDEVASAFDEAVARRRGRPPKRR